MDLLHLVDRLEELVATAQKMPIGSRAIVDRRRLLDIVDQMRIAVPHEVREAQDMVTRRDELGRVAEEEARMIVARAEQRAARLIEEHEITTAARQRAEEIAAQAESRLQERIEEANRDIQERLGDSRLLAEQQMTAADEYARELLTRLSTQLQAFVTSVDAGIAQLEPNAPATGPYGGSASRGVARRDDDDLDFDMAAEEETFEDDAEPRPPGGREGEFEDLLRRGEPSATRARGGSLIDDFDLPGLDDDPTRPGG